MRILLRHFASSVGASLLVALVVLLTATITAIAPRAVAVMTTAELRDQLDSLSVPLRDLEASAAGGIPQLAGKGQTDLPAGTAEFYGAMDDALEGIRSSTTPELRDLLGQAEYFSLSDPIRAGRAEPERDDPLMLVRAAFDPRIASRVTIVEGEFPEASDGETFPMMLSVQAADALEWAVGEVRNEGIPFLLSGTFEAVDAEAPYWQHATSTLRTFRYDDGNTTPSETAVGYGNPLSVSFFPGRATRATVWFPTDTSGLDFADAATIAPALRTFTSAVWPLPQDPRAAPQSLRFDSNAVDVLDDVLGRASATIAVLAMVASGPLGVVLAVFTLGANSVVARRRTAISLASARGASGWQVRGAVALEGAVLGVIPSIGGILLGALLVPARVGLVEIFAPALLGIALVGIFAASASPSALRTERADLGTSGRFRWIVEVLVVLLAAVAVLLLLRRGLATSAGNVGVDPLLAATPLLLALAVCVGVLRLYPLPLARLARALRNRAGLTGFLGATRAVRDRSLAIAAVLALVVAVSVSVFSSVLLSTLDGGIRSGAAATVGADLRAEGPAFGDELADSIRELPGVTAAGGIDEAGATVLRADGSPTSITLYVVDSVALASVRPDLPSLDREVNGAVPIVLSDDLELDSDADLEIEGEAVALAGTLDAGSGFGQRSAWAVVDRAFADRLTGLAWIPHLLLIDTEPGADAPTLATAIVELAGPTTEVQGLDGAIAEARSAPTVAGLRVGLVAAVVIAVLLAALAVILASAIGASARNRLLAMLRTLGMSSRQSGAIVAWELGPLAIAAVFAGTVLGLLLPLVVLAGVDLTPFTRGSEQPGIVVDPLLLGAVLGGVLLSVVAAGVVAVAISRRVDPARSLRIGAE